MIKVLGHQPRAAIWSRHWATKHSSHPLQVRQKELSHYGRRPEPCSCSILSGLVHLEHPVLLSASRDCCHRLLLPGTKCKRSWRISPSCRCIKNSQDPECHRAGVRNNSDHHIRRSLYEWRVLRRQFLFASRCV